MRMLLVGDVHGNDRFFASMCRLAAEKECDRLVQLGDFGYWEHFPQGTGFLKWCEKQLSLWGIEGYWLDGNHENHPLLWEKYAPGGRAHKSHDQGFWEIREGLYYMPRGHRWVWDDVSFLSLGGAYSIDKDMRSPGRSWWATESISDDQVAKACEGGKVDVMLTHDCPEGAPVPTLLQQHIDIFPESRLCRQQISRVFNFVQPRFLAHGHYHDRYSCVMQGTQIEGLGADLSPFSQTFFVLDTKDLHGDG